MAKDTCEESRGLSVFWLKKHDYFCGWKSGGIRWISGFGNESSIGFTVDIQEPFRHIRFNYTRTGWDGEKEKMDYRIELTTTPCYFGSKRYWFVCPLSVSGIPCNRRVGILYLAGKWFGCRKCYDLAYDSQQFSRGGSLGALFKYMTLTERLGKKEDMMRVKYWRGRPTKRYARFLQKARILDGYGERALMEAEVMKRCGMGRKTV
ncbi:hypothetical protein HYV73_00950 [Candidatus Uhrbacteria bacterium]|nr:hypothetical protein [Candidatus Uhrbacteria bacterium]